MVIGVTDKKMTSSKGVLVLSNYGDDGGQVVWRRLGNALEVHTADAAFEQGLYAHVLRMADAMDKAPKIDALRFTTTSNVPEGFAALLKSAGAKEYAGGMRLTREQTLALRDQIVHAADAGEAAGATVVEAFKPLWLPNWGINADVIGKYGLTVVPQKQGFTKMLYADADAYVRVRFNSTQLVWTKVVAASPVDEGDVAFAYLRDMGHDLATHPSIDSVRFDNWEDLPLSVRTALSDFDSFVGTATHTMGRQNALDLSAAIEADVKGTLGLGTSVAEHAVAPVEAVTPSFSAVVHADAATVHE